MRIEVYPVARVIGSTCSGKGEHIDVKCAWTDGEAFMLRLSLPVANAMQIAIQDAAADAALRAETKPLPRLPKHCSSRLHP